MASRFWVTQPVSGAIVSVASAPQIRLTVSSTTGMTTGDVRTVSGVGGTTEANGTWTITVIDATHIDLQGTTFTNVYTSGGSVNGKWDATNANNWVSSSGGTNYGQTVPGSSDTATLDGSSGGGTVTVGADIAIQSLTTSAFTGTFTVGAHNVTLSASGGWTDAATGVHTTNAGSLTWTFTNAGGGTQLSLTASANHTFNCETSTFLFSATGTSARVFNGGAKTFNNFTVTNAAMNQFLIDFANSGNCTFANLTLTNVQQVRLPAGGNLTITGSMTWDGTSISQGLLYSSGAACTLTVAAATALSWLAVQNVTKAGAGSIVVTNGFDGGGNTGVTITRPARVFGA